MSKLVLPDGIPDFTKAVISFWFRLPINSLTATADAWEANDSIVFNGVLPLVVFGAFVIEEEDPCYIGVVCSRTEGAVSSILRINLPASTINTTLEVAADQWHHLLLSFDLVDTAGVEIAYDDVFYEGEGTVTIMDGVHSAGYPFGIPSTPAYAKYIRQCEFAEFQMWTGFVLGAGNDITRRLFISSDGLPVDPDIAEKQLDTPLILLHGSARWKRGDNTGFAPDLNPTPVINRYAPDPNLHGEQGPRGSNQPPGGAAAADEDIVQP